jgi:hypothetical protein
VSTANCGQQLNDSQKRFEGKHSQQNAKASSYSESANAQVKFPFHLISQRWLQIEAEGAAQSIGPGEAEIV